MMHHPSYKGILLMIISSLLFSMMGAMVKYATEGLPFMEVVFFRTGVMLVLLTPWMAIKKISFKPKNPSIMFLRAISGFTALAMSFYVTSKIELANAAILNHTSVIFVAMLSAIFLKEKVSLSLVLCIFCSLIGAALIIKPSLEVVNTPGLVGLVSGFFAAIAYVSVKKLHDTEHFLTIVWNFAIVGTILSLLLTLSNFKIPSTYQWLALIGLGSIATLAQMALTASYKYGDASLISPYSFTTVIFSGIWGMFFWNELPDAWDLLGTLVIIACGIGIMNIKSGEILFYKKSK